MPSAPPAESTPRSLTPPLLTRERTVPLQRLRIHDYLVMTQTLMWSRAGDRPGALGLALRACDTNGNDELATVAELLEGVQSSGTRGSRWTTRPTGWIHTRSAMRLLQMADALVLDV